VLCKGPLAKPSAPAAPLKPCNCSDNLVFYDVKGKESSRIRGNTMRYLKYAVLLGILFLCAASAQAQVAVRVGVGPAYVGIGPEPVCAYGYYPNYPYACAPYGYWGPNYFVGGVFIGAGPWYHGYWGRGYYGGYYGHPVYGPYRPGYAYRPGYGSRPAPAYAGPPARGYVGGGYHGPAGGGYRPAMASGFHGGLRR